MRIRDLSLSFIILYSFFFSFYIPQPFLTCFHTLTAAGDSVKIGHVQQESPLASLLPFFSVSPEGLVCGWDCRDLLTFAEIMPIKV